MPRHPFFIFPPTRRVWNIVGLPPANRPLIALGPSRPISNPSTVRQRFFMEPRPRISYSICRRRVFLHGVVSIKICEWRTVWDVEQLEAYPRFNHPYKMGVVAVAVAVAAVAEGYHPGPFPATTLQQSTLRTKVTGMQPSGRNLQICLQIRPSTADSNAWLNASKKGMPGHPFLFPDR